MITLLYSQYRIWETRTGKEKLTTVGPLKYASWDEVTGFLDAHTDASTHIWDVREEREVLRNAVPFA